MTHHLRTSLRIVLLVSLWAVVTFAAGASWHVGQGDVSVKCPMTIGGSFDATTAALTGMLTTSTARPSGFDGSLAVDLRTIDTGIALRNDHLKEKYLEIDKGAGYEQAVLSDVVLQGLNADAPTGKGSFTGSLMLHEYRFACRYSCRARERHRRPPSRSLCAHDSADHRLVLVTTDR